MTNAYPTTTTTTTSITTTITTTRRHRRHLVEVARRYTGERFYDFQRLCAQKAIKPSGVCRTAVSSKSLRRQRRRRCRLLRAAVLRRLMEHTSSLYANRIYPQYIYTHRYIRSRVYINVYSSAMHTTIIIIIIYTTFSLAINIMHLCEQAKFINTPKRLKEYISRRYFI